MDPISHYTLVKDIYNFTYVNVKLEILPSSQSPHQQQIIRLCKTYKRCPNECSAWTDVASSRQLRINRLMQVCPQYYCNTLRWYFCVRILLQKENTLLNFYNQMPKKSMKNNKVMTKIFNQRCLRQPGNTVGLKLQIFLEQLVPTEYESMVLARIQLQPSSMDTAR